MNESRREPGSPGVTPALPVGNRIETMLSRYLQGALRLAHSELLPEDGRFYGEVPACPGVYATARTLEACREEIAEVLEEWILLRVSRNLPLPVIEGIELKVRDVA